ncbi:MAG: aldehyde reductase [Chitinophagaceae bacterium]|nr:MAG: aldehyde reductase [Chitinophagaceae bacterium]
MQNDIILVTGGSGFVGVHTILQLLQQGYKVRTTVRSISKREDIIAALQTGGIGNFDNLSFFEADLLSDKGWPEATAGVKYVLHVASPFPLAQPEDENELIIPARDGSLRVLRASLDAGVKRVVLTSSFAAVGYGETKPGYTWSEKDWTNENAPIMPYIKSKTIAERAAWDFIKKEGGQMELSVINPVGIFGPKLGTIASASIKGVIEPLINGQISENPAFTFGIVDVRDVASLHITAMTHPGAAGERFLAVSGHSKSFADVAELITKERPGKAAAIKILQPLAEGLYVSISNEKATSVLGWHPRSPEEAILASVDSL